VAEPKCKMETGNTGCRRRQNRGMATTTQTPQTRKSTGPTGITQHGHREARRTAAMEKLRQSIDTHFFFFFFFFVVVVVGFIYHWSYSLSSLPTDSFFFLC